MEMDAHNKREDLSSQSLDVNDVLVKIGNPGKYQLWTFFCTALPVIFTGLIHLQPIFTHGDMDYKCTEANWTDYQNLTNSTNECSIKFENGTELTCTQFSYSSPFFKSTINSEFNLVCGRQYLSTLSSTLYLAATIPGGWIALVLADKLGRKTTCLIWSVVAIVLGVIQIYSVNIVMYIVFRMMIILPTVGIYDSLVGLVMEITAPSARPRLVIGVVFFWGIGVLALSAAAYAFREWRNLVLASTLPYGAFFIAFFWVIDESPHWLYSRGRINKAQVVINKIARWNNFQGESYEIKLSKKMPNNSDENIVRETCCDLFKAKKLLIIVAVSSYLWVSTSMGYTGLSFGLGSLAGDVYLNNTIGGCVEIASYCIAFAVLYAGRKKIFISLAAIGGVGLISAALVDYYASDKLWLVIVSTMVGRLSVAANWQILFLWCMEIYPTSMRMTLLAVSQTLGNAGSASSVFLNDAHKYITNPAIAGKMIAPMTYGVMLAIGALLAVLLPETNNKPLPITIKDASNSHKKSEEHDSYQWNHKNRGEDAF